MTALLEIAVDIQGERQLRRCGGDGGLGQEVAVEALIVARAVDPDIAGAQPVAQGGADRDLVTAPVDLAVLEHQCLPFLVRERHRRRRRDLGPALAAVHLAQDLDCDQDRIARLGCLEGEGLEEGRRVFAQCQVLAGGGDKRILLHELGQRRDLGLGLHQRPPADFLLDHGEGVEIPLMGVLERRQRLVEQAHQAADVLRRRLVLPSFRRLARVNMAPTSLSNISTAASARRLSRSIIWAISVARRRRRP